jgi:hypothetical protein
MPTKNEITHGRNTSNGIGNNRRVIKPIALPIHSTGAVTADKQKSKPLHDPSPPKSLAIQWYVPEDRAIPIMAKMGVRMMTHKKYNRGPASLIDPD